MKKVRRLAEDFKPDHYELYLHPDRQHMIFSGRVVVRGQKISRPAKRLTFHQKGLKITAATLTRHLKTGDETFAVERINLHKAFDEVRLHTKNNLFPGRYTITLEFSGRITDDMHGIYPAYFKHAGKAKKIIATQFESHHAREVFPCIDEPEAKATFDLTLVTPKGETVLSNTPIKEQRAKSEERRAKDKKPGAKPSKPSALIETEFERTPRMSTYLLAFVFGDLKYKEAETQGGVTVRAYATPDNAEFTQFGLDVAVKCLDFYNQYFGIDYPLDKCDLIALPDFASGAMENWGCITFREQAFLVDPANTSLIAKQYVAMVVAHELAHQWFGNLVTMRWWTDLWLNEGFASWIEFLAVDHIFPDWQMWTQFIVDEQQRALQLDALHHTHAIEVPVKSPDEIRTIFDTISYSKGSSVIHMLHEYLGKDMFREGLSFYLSQHQHANTDTVDLWRALEQVSERPVRSFMHAWTAQVGFPIIHADVRESQINLRQERFLLNKMTKPGSSATWPIPLLATPAVSTEISSDKSLKLTLKNSDEFRLNSGHGGFYRVVYNATHQRRLGQRVAEGHLDVLDRLGLLADAFEAAKAGFANTAETLQLLEFYLNEDSAVVWDIIAAGLASIRVVMDDESLREAMKPFVRKLAAKQLGRLGWRENPHETHLDKLLRPTILGMNAISDNPSVLLHCDRLWAKMKRTVDIPPDLRGVVFNTIARLGGKPEFERLLHLHNSSHLSEERTTLASALSNFEQPALIKRTLGLITTDAVRRQDVAYWVAYGFNNRFAKRLTWQWLKDNWDWLEANVSSDFSFYRFPMYAARAFSDPKFLAEFKAFFEPRRTPMLARAIDQGIETIEWQSKWKARDLEQLKLFFGKN